jgi:hypothetical protein
MEAKRQQVEDAKALMNATSHPLDLDSAVDGSSNTDDLAS